MAHYIVPYRPDGWSHPAPESSTDVQYVMLPLAEDLRLLVELTRNPLTGEPIIRDAKIERLRSAHYRRAASWRRVRTVPKREIALVAEREAEH